MSDKRSLREEFGIPGDEYRADEEMASFDLDEMLEAHRSEHESSPTGAGENGEEPPRVGPKIVFPEESEKADGKDELSTAESETEGETFTVCPPKQSRTVRIPLLNYLRHPKGEPVEDRAKKAADLETIEKKIRQAKEKLSISIEEFEEVEEEDGEVPDFLDEQPHTSKQSEPVPLDPPVRHSRRREQREPAHLEQNPLDQISDEDELRTRLHALTAKNALKIAGALLLSVALLYFGLSQVVPLPVPIFWCKALAPQGFAIFNFVCTALLVLIAGSLFFTMPVAKARRRYSFFPLFFFGAGFVLLENLVQIFAAEATAAQPLFNGVFAIPTFLLILSECSFHKKLRSDHRFAAGKGGRAGVHFSREDSVYDDGDYITASLTPLAEQKHSRFFDCATERSSVEQKSPIYLVVLLSAALVVAICSAVRGGRFSFFSGLSLAGCLIFPPSLLLSGTLLHTAAFGMLRRRGGILLGYRAAQNAAQTDEIVLGERDLFPKYRMKFCGIKIYHNVKIDDLVVKAASVFSRADSSLFDLLLDVMDGHEELIQPVSEYFVAPGHGIRATVGGSKIIIGDRKFLRESMIYVPDDGLADKLRAGGKYPLYVACDGKIGALFSLKYQREEHMAAALKRLSTLNIALSVRSDNPLITAEMLEDTYRLVSPLDVLPCQEPEGEEERSILIDRAHPDVFARLIDRALRFASLSGIAELVSLFNLAFGIILSLVLVLTGTLAALPITTVLLLQLFWALPSLGFLCYFKLKK